MALGLVFSGGAARGAYEVGVLRHLVEHVLPDVGGTWPFQVLCGTSAGAIHACAMAAGAHEPAAAARMLADRWLGFEVDRFVRPDLRALVATLTALLGRPRRGRTARQRGLLDPASVAELVAQIPFGQLGPNLAQGRVTGVSVSTTHVATGRTVVFTQRRERTVAARSSDPTVVTREVVLGPEHAMASAAIPLLFPAVRIDGDHYCDGGLRQDVPLSPARHLGADALLVVSPRHVAADDLDARRAHEEAFLDPVFLAGKALNALLLDGFDSDVYRLEQINGLLAAGERRFGPGYLDALNDELGRSGPDALRVVQAQVVRASVDLGRLAGEVVRTREFRRRATGLVGRALVRLAEGPRGDQADLLSYLLFDRAFSGPLIELGQLDAARSHESLCRLVAGQEPSPPPRSIEVDHPEPR
ncbi:MAG: patatin-like phospholipase family protein [Deltaproteobacteria bacterium]|nr:patatin-like phospholipase family protein [Deltaproteobacteria bacterium]